jgi:hypothetical protein
MGIIAFDITATREYVLQEDTHEPHTTFLIGHLDTALRNHLEDKTTSFGVNKDGADSPATVQLDLSRRNCEIVRFGVKGWQHFVDKDGRDIDFAQVSVAVPGVGNRKGLSDRLLDFLQPYIAELAGEVMKANTLTEEEEKN